MFIEEYMTERGWTVKENKPHRIMYAGFFKAKDQQWAGRILVTNQDDRTQVRPMIHDPPAEIKKLPQGKCLRLIGNNWFDLHWDKPPTSASDCLIYIEGLFLKAITS